MGLRSHNSPRFQLVLTSSVRSLEGFFRGGKFLPCCKPGVNPGPALMVSHITAQNMNELPVYFIPADSWDAGIPTTHHSLMHLFSQFQHFI